MGVRGLGCPGIVPDRVAVRFLWSLSDAFGVRCGLRVPKRDARPAPTRAHIRRQSSQQTHVLTAAQSREDLPVQHEAEIVRPETGEVCTEGSWAGEGGRDGGEGDQAVARMGERAAGVLVDHDAPPAVDAGESELSIGGVGEAGEGRRGGHGGARIGRGLG